MKALLVVVMLLAFGACVCWSNTPEEIAELKEATEQGSGSTRPTARTLTSSTTLTT